MTLLIGLSGPAGAGKSTVAEYLQKTYGAVRYSLATPLKEIARRVFDFSEAQLFGTQPEKEAIDPRYGFSPRTLLQKLGTEGIRAVFGEDFWVDFLIDRIDRERPYLAVVEDVRFQNEALALKEWEARCYGKSRALIWRIRPPEISPATHQSETEWQLIKADNEIMPTMRGLDVLGLLVDRLCYSYGIEALVKGRPTGPGDFNGEF